MGVDLSYPVPLRELRGELSDRNLSLSEAEQLLTAEEGEIELGDGEITSWESVFETKQSDYHSDVHQAADLTPRVFTSVELDESATSLGFDSDQPPVRTPDTVMSKAKEPYDEVGPLHGKVEKEFLYGTLLASDLVPFAHRDFRPVVVPATPNRTNYEVLELEQAREGGYPGLANWLEEANKHWSSDKEGVQTVSQRLNHWGRITSQNPGATYKVGYTGRGKNLAGCVVKSDSVSDRSNDPRLELQGVILDHSVFYYETDDEEEAYYLAAVLNSDVLTERVNSMQTKGDFGARNIQKIPFEFPLPVYDPNDPNHQRLIELAKQGEKKALAALPDLEKEYEPDKKPMNIRWVREKISNKVEPELNEVDEIVEGYLDF